MRINKETTHDYPLTRLPRPPELNVIRAKVRLQVKPGEVSAALPPAHILTPRRLWLRQINAYAGPVRGQCTIRRKRYPLPPETGTHMAHIPAEPFNVQHAAVTGHIIDNQVLRPDCPVVCDLPPRMGHIRLHNYGLGYSLRRTVHARRSQG